MRLMGGILAALLRVSHRFTGLLDMRDAGNLLEKRRMNLFGRNTLAGLLHWSFHVAPKLRSSTSTYHHEQNLIPMTANGISRSLRITRQDGSTN